MSWEGVWLDGEYELNDTVRDETWTMIANKTTTDRPAPQPFGAKSYLLPDSPTWIINSNADVIWAGLRVSNLTKTYRISAVRVWLPDVNPSVKYRVVSENNTTGVIKVGQTFSGDILGSPGWLTATIEPLWLPMNTDTTLWLISENIASTTTFNHPWNYIGKSNQDNNPQNGNIENRGSQTVLRISNVDDDGTNRSSDLLQATTGTIIRLATESDTTRYYEYEVISLSDEGLWVLYDVSFIEEGTGGEPLEERSTVTFTIPVAASVDYVELTNEWNSSPTLNGELKIGSGSQVSNQNAYGVDILVQEYIKSDDWDLVAHSAF